MIVIVKSGPETPEGRRAVKLSRDMAADLVLLQNGVYFACKDRLEGFCGTVHALEDDCRLRGLTENDLERDISMIDYERLIDLMVAEEKVLGML
jgi:sulfur relay protein TusB/DsrH